MTGEGKERAQSIGSDLRTLECTPLYHPSLQLLTLDRRERANIRQREDCLRCSRALIGRRIDDEQDHIGMDISWQALDLVFRKRRNAFKDDEALGGGKRKNGYFVEQTRVCQARRGNRAAIFRSMLLRKPLNPPPSLLGKSVGVLAGQKEDVFEHDTILECAERYARERTTVWSHCTNRSCAGINATVQYIVNFSTHAHGYTKANTLYCTDMTKQRSTQSQRTKILLLGSAMVLSAFFVGIQTAGDVRPISLIEAGVVVSSDMDGDGIVDARDALVILEVVSGYRDVTPEMLRSDPNRDGILTIDDAIRILATAPDQ